MYKMVNKMWTLLKIENYNYCSFSFHGYTLRVMFITPKIHSVPYMIVFGKKYFKHFCYFLFRLSNL